MGAEEEEEDILYMAADVVVDCHCRFSICRSSEITREEAVVVIAEVSSLFFFSSLHLALSISNCRWVFLLSFFSLLLFLPYTDSFFVMH